MSGSTNVPEVSVMVRKDGKLLFVLRQHTGYADGTYALPGGHVEHGEAFSAAAVRESLEEVGIRIQTQDLQPLLHMQRRGRTADDVRTGVFFEALHWEGEPENREPERHGELAWFDADNLPFDTIMPFQAVALRAMAKGQMYVELGWGTTDNRSVV